MTSSDPDPCRRLVAGVHEDDVADCLNNETLHTSFSNCKGFSTQLAFHFLHVLASLRPRPSFCDSPPFVLNLYGTHNISNVIDDLVSGTLDVFPFETVVDYAQVESVPTTTALDITSYHFFMNADAQKTSMKYTPMSFLTSPFSKKVWMCILLTSFFAGVAKLIIMRAKPHGFPICISDRCYFLLVVMPYVMLGVSHSTELQARVIQPTVMAPFQSVQDLAERVRKGELNIIVESKYTERWNLLRDRSINITVSLQSLRDAIRDTHGALTDVRQMSNVCKRLRNSARSVYFGYEEMLLTECNDLCFWRFEFSETPNQYSAFMMRKDSALLEAGNLAGFALPNYRTLILNRRYKLRCVQANLHGELINIDSLIIVIALLISGWAISLLAYCCELVSFRMRSGKQSFYALDHSN